MIGTVAKSAGTETRQSMIRVWMAISAVWVAFWLLTAGVALAAVEMRVPIEDQLGLFSLIVITPPLLLLALGATGRFLFEVVVHKR
jgi:hypothetical protein